MGRLARDARVLKAPFLLAGIAVAAAAVTSGCGGREGLLHLSVTPASALVDTPVNIQVAGLRAGEQVTIRVSARSHLGNPWRGELVSRADAHGHVDLRDEYVLARLHPARKPPAGDHLLSNQTDVTFVVHADGRAVTARARSILQPPSVSISDERPRHVGFYGEWFTPGGTRRHTTILFMGGSEGGEPLYPAAYMLAARGYPVLALAYFREPGLPKTLLRIPLEYFQHALRWMRQRRGVDRARIVTFGISRGGELSLILASTFPHLIDGAIDYVGADVAIGSLPLSQPAWTYRGRPVPVVVPLDRIAGPVFAVGGGADPLTSSATIEDIQRQLKGRDHRDVTLIYPHAGHGVGLGVPDEPERSTTVKVFYGKLYLGGSPQADEAAREDSWPRLLRFLAKLATH